MHWQHDVRLARDEQRGTARLQMYSHVTILTMVCVQYQEVKRLVAAIAFKIPELEDAMKAQELGNAIYGLQNMSSEARPVREVMFALSSQLTKYVNQFDEEADEEVSDEDEDEDFGDVLLDVNRVSKFSLSAQEISNALYGLRNMSDSHRDTKNMLSAILPVLRNPTTTFSSQAVGNALYGLQSMSANSKEVRRVVDALAEQIAKCKEPLNAQALGNALYGLKSMDSSSAEVKRLLLAIAEKIRLSENRLRLSGQSIGNALYGLKNMSSDVYEVRETLLVLTNAVEKSSALMNAQAIGNAMYGLSSMTSECDAVVRLVRALSEKVSTCPEKLSAQAVSNALYGMQNLSSSLPEVQHLLSALASKIYECEEPMNDQCVGNALYGLKSVSMADGSAVREVVAALAHYFYYSSIAYTSDGKLVGSCLIKLDAGDKSSNSNRYLSSTYNLHKKASSNEEVRGVIPLSGKVIGMALYGLRGMSSEYIEAKALLAVMLPSIVVTTKKLDGQFIGNSLYGLQQMSCQSEEVKKLMIFLIAKMGIGDIGILSGHEISNALYGCRSMETCDETESFINALAPHMRECSDVFSPLAISECFVGMQNMKFGGGVEALFDILNERIDKCLDPFEMDHIAMVCYAFKSLDDTCGASLGSLLDKLFNIVCRANYELSPQHCANILYGLGNCPNSGSGLLGLTLSWCLDVHDQLSATDPSTLGSSDLLQRHEPVYWRILSQNLQIFLDVEKSMPSEIRQKLLGLCELLNDALPQSGDANEINVAEQNVLSDLKHMLGEDLLQSLDVSVHEYLHSFQSDIIIRTRPGNSAKQIVINVEVDGYIHGGVNKRDFCRRRDMHLEGKGIHVMRAALRADRTNELGEISRSIQKLVSYK